MLIPPLVHTSASPHPAATESTIPSWSRAGHRLLPRHAHSPDCTPPHGHHKHSARRKSNGHNLGHPETQHVACMMGPTGQMVHTASNNRFSRVNRDKPLPVTGHPGGTPEEPGRSTGHQPLNPCGLPGFRPPQGPRAPFPTSGMNQKTSHARCWLKGDSAPRPCHQLFFASHW